MSSSVEAWSQVSSEYARWLAPHCAAYAADALAKAGLPKGTRLLDVGAGPGTLAIPAAQAGSRVTAVDLSPTMLAILRAEADVRGVQDDLECRVEDGEALSAPDGSFDAAFSIFGVIFFANPHRGITELHRVLRPDGTVVVTSWANLEHVPALGQFFRALRAEGPDLDLPPLRTPFNEPHDLAAALASAGFRDVRVHTVAHVLRFESVAEFVGSFACSAAPLTAVRKRVGPVRWREVLAEVTRTLTSRLSARNLALEMPAHIGLARR